MLGGLAALAILLEGMWVSGPVSEPLSQFPGREIVGTLLLILITPIIVAVFAGMKLAKANRKTVG